MHIYLERGGQTVDWYKQRNPVRSNHLRRNVGVFLNERQWAELEREARERELSMSYMIAKIVGAWADAKKDERAAHEAAELVKQDALRARAE